MSDSAPAPAAVPSGLADLLRSPAARVAMILVLLLLMQIPLQLVAGLIDERRERQAEVATGFTQGWGPAQAVTGPALLVPYAWIEPPARAGAPGRRLHGWLRIPAAHLSADIALAPETRRRGLFHAVVYTATVALAGAITIPSIELKGLSDTTVDWAGARVAVGASDLRGLAPDTGLDWNGTTVPLDDATDIGFCGQGLLSAPAGLAAAPAPGSALPFKTTLSLRGTQAFSIVPVGRQIDLRITAPWPTPSFIGASLPVRHDIGADGFTAAWAINGAAGVTRAEQRGDDAATCAAPPQSSADQPDSQIGVELQEAVPTYLMVSRAAKYGVLFLTLAYLTLFLFEMIFGARVHLVQYGLIGLSIALFALLLISIAEPLGFTPAYILSTLAVLAQASLYALSVLRRRRLALIFSGVLAGLFAFLYVVLSLDSYALLAGTAALFIILSMVMLVTRNIDWAARGAARGA